MAGGDRGGGSAPSNSVASAAPLTTTDPLFIESALATETPWSDKHIGTNSISVKTGTRRRD